MAKPPPRKGPPAPNNPGRGPGPFPPKNDVPKPPTVPKQEPKGQGVEGTLRRLAAKYPGWAKYIPVLKQAADRWGANAVELLALLIFENESANPGATSSVGALGLSQIHDTAVDKSLNPAQYKTFVQQWGSTITPEMKRNPAFALAYAAWRMAGSRAKYGSLDEWYAGQAANGRPRGYNPGFPGDSRGKGPSAILAKAGVKVVPGAIPQSPTDKAGSSVETAGARNALTDPWVVVKNGKVTYEYGVEPPKNVAKRAGGIPITASQWEQAKMAYGSIWYSLTGETAIPPERMVNWLRNGWSPTVVSNVVAKNHPKVTNSPLWKAKVPGMVGKAKALFGNDWKIDQDFFRKAVAEGWDDATLEAKLKARPEYVTGPVFKDMEAAFTYSFTKIYGGKLTPEDRVTVKEAVANGWTQAQWEQWLRSNETYGSSAEAQDKTLALLDALGMLTGQQAVLRPGEMPANPNYEPPSKPAGSRKDGSDLPPGLVGNPNQTGTPGDDPRIAGKGTPVGKKSNLVGGYR